MNSRSLVICDQEENYAAALASFFTRKKGLALGVQVCSNLVQVMEFQKEHPIDILLIGNEFPKEDREKIKASNVFVLTSSEREDVRDQEKSVYRYQSGEAIMGEVVSRCSETYETESLFLKSVRKKQMKVIGIFSPIHRIGKTSYALEIGKKLAASQNVLYLNMEIYGGIGGYFPETGQTLADALYYSRQERKNFGAALAGMVKHLGPLDYLLPMKISEDMKAVEPEEWTCLLGQIANNSIYDVLILDIDEGIRGVYGILRLCTEIYVPTVSDEIAKAKLFQFEQELHVLGYDDVYRKIGRREMGG